MSSAGTSKGYFETCCRWLLLTLTHYLDTLRENKKAHGKSIYFPSRSYRQQRLPYPLSFRPQTVPGKRQRLSSEVISTHSNWIG